MADKTLNTVIVLRNDNTTNWAASSYVLKAGEVGIEKRPDGKVIAKVGDGQHTWAELPQIEGIFEENLTFTYQFGKYSPSNGMVEVPAKGKTTSELLLDAFAQAQNPNVTQPSITITVANNSGTAEVGSAIPTPTGTAKISGLGSYQYGSKDGVTLNGQGEEVVFAANVTGLEIATGAGQITCSAGTDGNPVKNTAVVKTNGGEIAKITPNVAGVTYKDSAVTYTFNASAIFTNPSKYVPINNLGNKVESLKLGTITKTATASASYSGYRNMFWGGMTADTAINSTNIRALSGKKKVATGALTRFGPGVGAGTGKVVVAIPEARSITKVLLPSALNADITSQFVLQSGRVSVEGANGFTGANYKVYVYQPASIDAGQLYDVTIG